MLTCLTVWLTVKLDDIKLELVELSGVVELCGVSESDRC